MPDKSEIVSYLRKLRDCIRIAFAEFETEASFVQTNWDHSTGGGGEISLLRGHVFEKAAVNFSEVHGESFPLPSHTGPFYATGVSLITHMMNPHAPTVHMNIRYIENGEKWWFGGGYDLTPMGFPYEEDKAHFHDKAKEALKSFGTYEEFRKNAQDYFFIPHRKKERGVGGIFFDYVNSGSPDRDLAMWQSVGDTFLEAYVPILKKRVETPYSEQEKREQNLARAHYVEFNLLYDRGTKFGFSSGGNPEAILCSMPPAAYW